MCDYMLLMDIVHLGFYESCFVSMDVFWYHESMVRSTFTSHLSFCSTGYRLWYLQKLGGSTDGSMPKVGVGRNGVVMFDLLEMCILSLLTGG